MHCRTELLGQVALSDLRVLTPSILLKVNRISGVRQAAGDARIYVAGSTTELAVEILAQSKAEGIPENEIHGVLGQGGAYNAVCEVRSL